MEWKPTKRNKFPLYRQIADYLETRISNGEFPPGSRLPSERDLANIWQVNRSTINSAFEELRTTGLINRTVGQGTIVQGVVEKRLPNWDMYVKEGFYQPNNPLNQKIYQFIGTNKNIINFAIGELSPDLLPVTLMKSVQNSINLETHLGYEHVQGNIELRETIKNHLMEYRNIESDPSSILVTSGAQQAIQLIIRCLLKPGDAVAIENPSYAYSLPIFHSEGLHTHLLPVHETGIDPDQVLTLYKKHRIKMIFLNPTFQNPTGRSLDETKRKKILEMCGKFGIPIVEDDPYSIIGYSNSPVRPLKSEDKEGLVLYVSSLSKLIASGLRIGWIVGPQNVIDRLADAKQQIDFGLSPFPQMIAANILKSDHFDDHIANLKKGLKAKRDLIMEALYKELGDKISFSAPNGGIHLWCRLNSDVVLADSLFKESVKRGVVFAPGSTLSAEHNFLRLTYARVNTEDISKGIKQLASAFEFIEKKR